MSRSRGRRFQNLAYGDDNRFDKAINHTLDYFPNDDSGEDGDHIVVKYESIYYYGRKVDGKWIYFRSLFNNRNEEKLTLQHPVWNTLRAPATEFRAASSGGATWNATYLGYSFSSSATNTVHLILPIPHDWAEGTVIEPRIVWLPTTTNTGNVRWTLTYQWVNINNVQGTIAAGTSKVVDSAAGGTAYKNQITSFGNIDGVGKKIGSIFSATLARIGGHAADTYSAVCLLKNFNIHYQVDTLGSELPYIKRNL